MSYSYWVTPKSQFISRYIEARKLDRPRCAYCGCELVITTCDAKLIQAMGEEIRLIGISDPVVFQDGFGEYTKDHIVPKSRGGADTKDNLLLACKKCNSAKGALTGYEFYFLQERRGRKLNLTGVTLEELAQKDASVQNPSLQKDRTRKAWAYSHIEQWTALALNDEVELRIGARVDSQELGRGIVVEVYRPDIFVVAFADGKRYRFNRHQYAEYFSWNQQNDRRRLESPF